MEREKSDDRAKRERQSDEWVMHHLAQGHPEYLEQLLRRHASPLLTFIRRLLGDAHRSEDLFQEVFLVVWQKRHQYEYPRPFKPWLYAIALNKCRAVYRVRAPAVVPLVPEDPREPQADETSPFESMLASERADLVSRAVARLPHQQRAVVVLRIWEELPYEYIALVLDCTQATVRSHMHHGLAALRKMLEPHLETAGRGKS